MVAESKKKKDNNNNKNRWFECMRLSLFRFVDRNKSHSNDLGQDGFDIHVNKLGCGPHPSKFL